MMNIWRLAIALSIASQRASCALTTLCGQFDHATSIEGRYTYQTDVWGSYSYGVQCVYCDPEAVLNDNATWITSTWTWSEDETEVHSFANVQLNSVILPLQLSTLGQLYLNAYFAIVPGNKGATTSDISGVEALEARCDVVLDTFLAYNPNFASDVKKANVEIMVYLAAFGQLMPTGNRTVHSIIFLESVFDLFEGVGPTNQTVYSWYPRQNLYSLDADVSPLFTYLLTADLVSGALYLGLVQYGTETEHTNASQNVTWASTVMLDVSERNVASPVFIPSATSKSTGSTVTSTSSLLNTATVVTAASGSSTPSTESQSLETSTSSGSLSRISPSSVFTILIMIMLSSATQ